MTSEKKLHWYDETKTNSTSCGRAGMVAKSKKKITCLRCRSIVFPDKPIDEPPMPDDAPAMREKPEDGKRSRKKKPHNDPEIVSELISSKSLLDYAAEAIETSGEPLRCADMVKYAKDNGWISEGRTPTNTLNAAINKEINKSEESRFVKVEKGLYGLSS